uniref:Secreted protein n=1 Tax=Anopheles darlingi TaxID=43151 RepID=A0A2M4D309_ANODA
MCSSVVSSFFLLFYFLSVINSLDNCLNCLNCYFGIGFCCTVLCYTTRISYRSERERERKREKVEKIIIMQRSSKYFKKV